jgi:hypothetical protein
MTKLTKAEQEVHIWKCADEPGYCVYITDPAELPHHLGLAKKVGGRVIPHGCRSHIDGMNVEAVCFGLS